MSALLLWATTTAWAGPAERIARLYDRQDWTRASEVCVAESISRTGSSQLRSMCAEAIYRHTPPPDRVPELLQFTADWHGTRPARLTFSRAAVLALPDDESTEVAFRRHHRQYKGTQAAVISLERAERAAFLVARDTHSLEAWAAFLKRYPAGKLVRNARADALATGLEQATTSGNPATWQLLLDVVPGASTEIRAAGDTWRVKQIKQSLEGPCWDSPCATLAAGSRVEVAVPILPWGADVRLRWVLQTSDGQALTDAEGARTLRLQEEEFTQLTSFEPALGGVAWTAPVEWAQPPRYRGARWMLSLELGQADALTVPLQATAHWQAPGKSGWALAHYSEGGLWLHGPQHSTKWADHTREEWSRASQLADTDTHVFYTSEGQLYVLSKAGGEPQPLAVDQPVVTVEHSGDQVWVAGGSELLRCSERSCLSVHEETPKDVSPAQPWFLTQKTTKQGATWTILDTDGRTRLTHSFDGRCTSHRSCLPTYEAAFDSTGQRLLVAGSRDSKRILQVVDATSGSLLAEGHFDIANRVDHKQLGDVFAQIAPTDRPSEWVVVGGFLTNNYSGGLSVQIGHEGSLVVRRLYDDTELAWFQRMGDAQDASPRAPRGWGITVAKVGAMYELSLSQSGRGSGVVHATRFKRACSEQVIKPKPRATWLPFGRWVSVYPLYGWCSSVEGPYPVEGEPLIVRIPDGKVLPSPRPVSLIRSLSPDNKGFVTHKHAVLPSGRVVELPSKGEHEWMPVPLSMRLQVE